MRTPAAVVALAASVLLVAPASSSEDSFIKMAPDQVVWTDKAGFEGVKFALLAGDPSKPGIYVIRVKFSPGRMTRPHFHPEDRFAVVLKGTWYMGEGETFDPDKTVPLKPGSFAKHPAKAAHYDGAKDEEVIVQIVGYGPSGTTLIHPEQGETGPSLKK